LLQRKRLMNPNDPALASVAPLCLVPTGRIWPLRLRAAARASGLTLGLGLGAALLLAACGGGQGEQPLTKDTQEPTQVSDGMTGLRPAVSLAQLAQGGSAPGPASAADAARLARGAQLSQDSLAAAEQQALAADEALERQGQSAGQTANSPEPDLSALAPGQMAPKSAYLSGAVARKAAAVSIPAYRFYNTRTRAHFYTTSEAERTTVDTTLSPPFSFEGPAFSVASAFAPGLSSVHRFYNTRTGVHFYTISEEERADVVASLPQFSYEGVAYYASQVAGAGLTPLYRFYVPSRGFHFYTASITERDRINTTLNATYSYEGIGYYVLASGWSTRERLPHTGVTVEQCFQAGSNTLVPCGGPGALALNPQQDGHRSAVAPMSYFAEPSLFGPYPVTSCVRDNVTGLLWEGKTAAGERAGSNTYTNLGNNAATDASGHVAAVNASNLCGYSDWRLPTRQELLTLVDYGKTTAPRLNTTWFPNTASAQHWTGQGQSTFAGNAWFVDFSSSGGWSDYGARSTTLAVRLVRGAPLPLPRFSYSTVAYGSDAANNLVNDAWTGLQWRRCEEGRVWSGTTCTGIASRINHEDALAHARDQIGWRLPNVKELASLTDLGVSSGARIDQAAFPGAVVSTLKASTPSGGGLGYCGVSFSDGFVGVGFIRTTGNVGEVRLVRANP
jgi:hypothetical protein